jgi:GTPase SAR1 family protein
VDRLLAEGEAITQAFRMNHAFAAPEHLTTALRAHQAALKGKPTTRLLSLDDARTIAERMEQKLKTATWTSPQPLYEGPHGG